MVIEYTEGSLIDLDHIMEYYANTFGTSSALKIYRQIRKTICSLELFSNIGVPSKDPLLRSLGYKELYSGRFVIIYRPDIGEEKIYIYHIADSQQDYPHLFPDLRKK